MRIAAAVLILVLSACRESEPVDAAPADNRVSEVSGPVTYEAGGRNRLCIDPANRSAGLIVYAEGGDANCSVRGSATRLADKVTIVPDGDPNCRIEGQERDGVLTLRPVAPACAYYCGPDASYGGASFRPTASPQPVTDLAGDPIC